MSEYFYLLCPACESGVRLGQGWGSMDGIYSAQVPKLGAWLNRHRGHGLRFVADPDSIPGLGDDWIAWPGLIEPAKARAEKPGKAAPAASPCAVCGEQASFANPLYSWQKPDGEDTRAVCLACLVRREHPLARELSEALERRPGGYAVERTAP